MLIIILVTVVISTTPDTPSPVISSLDDLNRTSSDLNCSAILIDNDGDYMNASVNWYKNGALDLTMYYNLNYTNGTLFTAILNQSVRHFALYPFGNHTPNDFSVYYEDGWYHAYYIKSDMGFNARAFGYEKSQDLTHWSFMGNVIPINTTSNWMKSEVWAPHVIKNDSNYLMFYTAVNRDSLPIQRLALATSDNLIDWENANVNNCPNTDYHGCIWDCNLSWSSWTGDGTTWLDSCRDPMVFTDDDGMNYMVYVVNVPTNKAVIAIANSTNFVDWTDMGPINITSSANAGIDMAESPFIWKQNNTYYLYWTADNSPYYYIKETHTTDITNLSVGAWSTPTLASNGSYANEMLNITNSTGFDLWADLPAENYNITFKQFEINDTDNNITISGLSESILSGISYVGDEWKCEIRTFDGQSYSAWANSSTLTIAGPSVTLQIPQNNTSTNNDSITFQCLVEDNGAIYNISLWTNISGTWEENQTWDARSHANDENTTFLARFENSYLSEEGGSPATQTGTSFTTGKIGQSVLINGTDTLTYPVANNLNVNRGTIEMWIYPTEDWNIISSGDIKFLFNSNTFELYEDPSAGADEIAWSHDGGVPTLYGAPADWVANTWYHLAVTWDFDIDEYKMYIDGILVRSTTASKTAPTLGTNFYVGSHYSGDYWADSRIDDLRISNKVLTPTEINYSMNQTKNNVSARFTVNNLSRGGYIWNCKAKDEYNDTSFATSNNSLAINPAPNSPVVYINSSNGTNTTDQDLNCWANITDNVNDKLNVSIKWYNNSVEYISLDYNNSYSSGTKFNHTLGSGNTSLGEIWSCSIRIFDGYSYSAWTNSSILTIISPYTPPNPSPGGGRKFYFRQETIDKSGALNFDLLLKGDSTSSLVLENSLFGLKSISITPNKFTSGTISINQITEQDLSCQIDEGLKIYKIFEITHEGIPNENLDNVGLEFEIDKDWISSNKITNIKGVKCEGKTKRDLDISKEGDNYLFSSDGFSTWVITGAPEEEETLPPPKEELKDEEQSKIFQEIEERIVGTSKFPYLPVMTILTTLIILILLTQLKKKKPFKIYSTK